METPVTLTLTQIDTFYDPAISVNHCDTLPLDGRVGDTDKVCPTYFSRRRHYRVLSAQLLIHSMLKVIANAVMRLHLGGRCRYFAGFGIQ